MKTFFKKAKRIFLILWVAHLAYLVVLVWLNPPITIIMLGSIFRHFNSGPSFQHTNIGYDQMGEAIKWAVISSEDQLFATHQGIDFKSLGKVISGDGKKRLRGASTISQQTAKNVFLYNGRNWVRKGLEAYSTLLIELIWGKKRILETYLNVAEMGPNVFGIHAAAEYHFHKKPSALSSYEAAFIAALLPNPLKRTKEDKPIAQKKAQWIVSQMNYLKKDEALKELIQNEKK